MKYKPKVMVSQRTPIILTANRCPWIGGSCEEAFLNRCLLYRFDEKLNTQSLCAKYGVGRLSCTVLHWFALQYKFSTLECRAFLKSFC